MYFMQLLLDILFYLIIIIYKKLIYYLTHTNILVLTIDNMCVYSKKKTKTLLSN
jgi:hypothetical protein